MHIIILLLVKINVVYYVSVVSKINDYNHYTNLTFVSVCVCVCVYERKGHRKLFDPSLKSRFLCIAALRSYKSS